jgi:rubrerythrin
MDMLQMFPEPIFFTFFIAILILIIVSVAVSITRSIRFSEKDQGRTPEAQPTIKEREIIREIVKIRCSYCGNLYEEKEDKCPHCGGKKV